MGNQNRILIENHKNNNQINTEGTQGLMTLTTEKKDPILTKKKIVTRK